MMVRMRRKALLSHDIALRMVLRLIDLCFPLPPFAEIGFQRCTNADRLRGSDYARASWSAFWNLSSFWATSRICSGVAGE